MKYKERLPSGKPLLFRGAATALVTPFSEGVPDKDAFGKMIERQLDGGIAALVVCGTTGEAPTLSKDEALDLISFAADKVSGRVPVIAGVGSNDTAKSCVLAEEAYYAGADAVMAVTPYYNKTTDAGILSHFLAIAEASPVPVIIYNVPGRTSVRMTPRLYSELAGHSNIVAVKEASGDAGLSADILAENSGSLALYSGCDEITLPLLSLGGHGVVSVVSNIFPAMTEALCDLFFSGDIDGARIIQRRLHPLVRALFAEPNPIPVKAACAYLGLCSSEMRLPLSPQSDCAELKRLINGLRSFGNAF